MDISFDHLPQAVFQLHEKLNNIERLLLEKSNTAQPEPDRWFDLNELVAYDPEKRSKATFYGYTAKSEIPFQRNKKKLLFLKSEIDLWLKKGRNKTMDEISLKADTYLAKRGLK